MSDVVPTLRELHRLHRHARDLKTEIERGPRVLKAHQQKLAKQEADARDAHEAVKRLKMSVHEKEVSLKATHQQLVKYQKQLDEAAGKVYDLKLVEIAHAKDAAQKLEDEIFAGMTETDERTAQLPVIEQALQQARGEYAKFEEEAKARLARLTEELNQTQAAVKTTEATLPPPMLPSYNRLINAHGADAMAVVKDRACSHCRTGITQQQVNDLTAGHAVSCKSCGRLLYLPA
jgi:predicted  nucleic acid-binding Zn-ribbon protein